MSPEPFVTRAYLEAVIRVFAPWEGLPVPCPERDRAAERVRSARHELARQSVPERPGEQTRWDLPAVRFPEPPHR